MQKNTQDSRAGNREDGRPSRYKYKHFQNFSLVNRETGSMDGLCRTFFLGFGTSRLDFEALRFPREDSKGKKGWGWGGEKFLDHRHDTVN